MVLFGAFLVHAKSVHQDAFLVHAKSVHQDAIRFVVMNLFVMIMFGNLFSLI